MNEQIRSNGILKIGIGSMLVGLGTFFILEAAFVLIFWFTGVPEAWMTYAGGVCLAGGCFTAGIKMGSGIGKKGIAAGLCAGIILSLLIWVLASIFSGGYVLDSASVVKLAVGLVCGTIGGMIGVNK